MAKVVLTVSYLVVGRCDSRATSQHHVFVILTLTRGTATKVKGVKLNTTLLRLVAGLIK